MATSRKPSKNAPLDQEQAVLDRIVAQVNAEARAFDASMEWANNAGTQRGLLATRPYLDIGRPYFGHFRAKNLETRSEFFDLRIGLNGAQTKPQIVSWDAPIARAYHMRQGEPGKSGIFSISDRREIDIDRGEVTDIRTSYGFDTESSVQSAQTMRSSETESRLTKKLDKSRTGEFDHIVESIQEDQYIEISRSASGVLVLDGVAGSGKTMIGLHRVAYITSKEREPRERVDISRVVFLSPTPDLLRWSTKLRKDLRIDDMKFSTISKFMWDWLQAVTSVVVDKLEPNLEPNITQRPSKESVERAKSAIANRPIPAWLTGDPEPLIVHIPYKREIGKRMNPTDWDRFWSSDPALTDGTPQGGASNSTPYVDMNKVQSMLVDKIDNDTDRIRVGMVCDLLRFAQPIDITGDSLTLSVMSERADVHAELKSSYELVVAVIKAASWGASNSHYERIASVEIRFHNELFHRFEVPVKHGVLVKHEDPVKHMEQKESRILSERNRFRSNLLQIGQSFASQFALQAKLGTDAYRRELDPKWKQIAENTIEKFVNRAWPRTSLSNVLELPIGYSSDEDGTPDRASLAVMCAAVIQNLDEDDVERQTISHIVVDEAQELSEAEICFLRAVTESSLTLVGDSAQVLDQKSATVDKAPWIQGGSDVEIKEFNRSYRTTAKVTEFCNEVLALRGVLRLAQPYTPRPGKDVVVKALQSEGDQELAIIDWLSQVDDGTSLIVIPEIGGAMIRSRILRLLQDLDTESKTGCRVMTAAEARGLEFDHVFVPFASSANYPNSQNHGAAFYIACTRATATLTCAYFNQASPWLPLQREAWGKYSI